MSERKDNRREAPPARPGRGGGHRGLGRIPEKPKDFKGTFKKILKYLKPYYKSFAAIIFLALGSTIFTIIGPKILGKATSKIYEGLIGKVSGAPGGGIDFLYIKNIVLTLLSLYAASAIFSYLQNFIVAGVSQKISFNLREELSQKINRMPLKFFDKMTHGEILSRVTNDVDTMGQSLSQSLTQIVTTLATLIGVLIMMLSISFQMTLVALLIFPLSTGVVMAIIKRSQKYFRQQQKSLGNVNGHVEEIFGGHVVVKAFNGEDKAIEDFTKINRELYDSAWRSQFLSGMMWPIMGFIGNLGYVGVSILGGFLAIRRVIEVGDILAFIQYVRNFTQPIMQLAQITNVLQSTVAASERIFEFLEQEELSEDKEGFNVPDDIVGSVRFENVKFGYSEDKTVIHDFNTTIEPGQRIAIVGPTGAGKTTIVKLLMRFYELDEGAIYIDDTNISDLKRDKLRGFLGMVLQDTWLFNGTILENIRYGSQDATDEEVYKAARLAHADHFIKTLPNSYMMEINEEASNISAGQKQLITIARAFLKNPRILILDEATSSVDTRTEVLIQRAMDSLMKGRTSFIIAHRLSTIRNADLILVIRDGDIVETGTHKELLSREGFYAELYNSQFENEQVS